MGADAARSDWGDQLRNTEWTRTLTGFAASSGLDAVNVELVFEVKRHRSEESAVLARVTKSGGGITVNSSSSCTVRVASALNADVPEGDVWFQLWLVDTSTGENYLLQFGRFRVRDWPPV